MKFNRLLLVAALALLLGGSIALATQILDQDKLSSKTPKMDAVTRAQAPFFKNIASTLGIKGSRKGGICSANAAGVAVLEKTKTETDLVLGSYQGDTVVWRINERRAKVKQNLGRISEATGLAAADYNNDGANDLLVATQRGPRLLRSRAGRLVDVTSSSGLRPTRLGMAGAWGDFNRDGLLDLVITQGNNCVAGDADYHFGKMVLYRQNKDHTFSAADSLLSSAPARPGLGMAVAFIDLDRDGWLDIYQGNDILGGVGNQAWRNVNGQKFIAGFESSEIDVNSMGLGIGDINNDQILDIAISNIEPIQMLISQRNSNFPGAKEYQTKTLSQASAYRVIVTWGLIVEDFNNDGLEDIFSPSGGIEDGRPEQQTFYINKSRAPGGNNVTLQEIGSEIGLQGPLRGRSAATVDLNNDGLLDVAINSLNDPPAFYLNQGSQKKGSWLRVSLTGDPKKRSPRSACGAVLTLNVGKRSWIRQLDCGSEGFLSSSDKTVHFGTGTVDGQGLLNIRWPSGAEEIHPVELNRQYDFHQ